MLSLFLMKVNRLSTRKRGSKTNHKDVLIAEKLENKETTTIEAAEIDGKSEESLALLFKFIRC